MSQENVELIQAFFDAGRAQMERTGASTHRWLAVIDLPEAAALLEEDWHPQAVVDVSGRSTAASTTAPKAYGRASVPGWWRGRNSISSSSNSSRRATG
jgi:hypothetical protein